MRGADILPVLMLILAPLEGAPPHQFAEEDQSSDAPNQVPLAKPVMVAVPASELQLLDVLVAVTLRLFTPATMVVVAPLLPLDQA